MNFLVSTLAFAADRLAFNINIHKEATAQALPLSDLLGDPPQHEFLRVRVFNRPLITAPINAGRPAAQNSKSC